MIVHTGGMLAVSGSTHMPVKSFFGAVLIHNRPSVDVFAFQIDFRALFKGNPSGGLTGNSPNIFAPLFLFVGDKYLFGNSISLDASDQEELSANRVYELLLKIGESFPLEFFVVG